MVKHISLFMIVLLALSSLLSMGGVNQSHASSVTPLASPSFSLQVTPLSQTAAITGSAAYNIQIVPVGGFNSPVTLSLTTVPAHIFDSFNPNIISPGQSSGLVVTTESGIEPSTYSLTLTGTSGSLSKTQTLSLTVTEVTGIKNLVIPLNDFSISDSGGDLVLAIAGVRLAAVVTSCFSIQQNFYVDVPGKPSPTYWAQNVLLIGTTPLGHIDVWSTYNIYDATKSPMGYPIAQNLVPRIPGTGEISLPNTFNLTSVISGDQLVLTSDYNSFTFSLGATGAYISQLSDPQLLPQLDIVGGISSAQVTFSSSTDGAVESFVQLASSGWTSSVTQSLLSSPSAISTGETSLNLGWTLSEHARFINTNGADFGYSNGANIQGIGFVPSPAVATILMENGALSASDSSTGVSVIITGSSEYNGFLANVIFAQLSEQPSGTEQANVEAVGFYDLKILPSVSVPSGTAKVSFTSSGVSPQTNAMVYHQNGAWVDAADISVIGDTITGDIPVSALSGTPIIIGGKSVIEVPLSWLGDQQNPTDGSWSYYGTENVGITSLCALAFLNNGILNDKVRLALDWVVSHRQSDGSLNSGAVSREDNRVYESSMAILALVASKSLGYAPSDGTNLNTVVDNAVAFLRNAQCVGTSIDGYNYAADNSNYGGWGYPRAGGNWADLSNTQWAVLALAAATTAGISTVPSSVWENAAVFTIRCLNDAKYNPNWRGSSDGGFAYRPSGGSYESMTGAGVWSLGLCRSAGVGLVTVDGVSVSLDNAIGDGVNWLQTYASVSQNYGDGMYFYYYTMMSVAKAYVIVGKGTAWYQNMVSQLQSQAPSGHWFALWYEEPDTMATAEAILAIETRSAPPPSVPKELYVILGSYSNLYITDPYGRHIGIDPNTGQIVNEIPNATFSTNLEQNASIPDPIAGDYNISIYGTGTGPYNLTVEGEVNGTATSSTSFIGTALQGVVRELTATISEIYGPLTVIVTPNQVHDIAVTNVTADRAWVYQGFSANVNVTVLDNGDFNETVTVTLYYNITANKIIGTQNVTVSAGQNETVAFVWDTVDVPYCQNYTMTAVATIPADNNPADNTLAGGTVKVRILGDMNGDGTVDIYDAIEFSNYFGLRKGEALWNADADINRDGVTDIFDAIIIGEHFGISGSS